MMAQVPKFRFSSLIIFHNLFLHMYRCRWSVYTWKHFFSKVFINMLRWLKGKKMVGIPFVIEKIFSIQNNLRNGSSTALKKVPSSNENTISRWSFHSWTSFRLFLYNFHGKSFVFRIGSISRNNCRLNWTSTRLKEICENHGFIIFLDGGIRY